MESHIAVAKPMRGREMRSTVIPKDVMEAVRAVSLKAVEQTSLVNQLEMSRKDDCEVYHEGYVDGKLYLVPDSNLQAMRDIVNLKMKRRLSSAIQPSPAAAQEPKRYIEFNSRLESLVNKVDRLATGPEYLTGLDSVQPRDSDQRVPPILDENIKYKKVKLESSLGVTPHKSFSDMFPTDLENSLVKKRSFTPDIVLEDARSEAEDDEMTMEESNINIDIYRILLTGHIVEGSFPKIIVNLNYAGSDVLKSLAPDFKQHAKDGNIDIFVTGKFFIENILEESVGNPAYLRVGSNKIPVDDSCEVHEQRFSDIFDVGPIDILLEGEFSKNPDTLKYVPTFSIEILKKDIYEERYNTIDVEPTTVLYSKDHDVMTPFDVKEAAMNHLSKDNPAAKKGKRVHYVDVHEGTEEEFEFKAKSILEMIKGSKMYKSIILRKEQSGDDTSKSSSKHRLVRKTSSRMKREALVKRKLKLRGREKLTRNNKARQDGLGINHHEVKIYHTSGVTKSPFQEKYGDEQFNEKKRRKKKKGNIVNNPILAQMQEFFIT